MNVHFCLETVEEDMARFGRPNIFNTGQGSQFTSQAFTRLLKDNGIRISMDGKGCWRDNVFIERLWKQHQTRGGLSEGLRLRVTGQGVHRAVPDLLQPASASLGP
jgi:transposase InsO family protein